MDKDKIKHRRLQELDNSDFEIVKGEPDIRGWDVKNAHGQKIGEVEELIVDAQQKKVRYMVVDLDDNELKLSHRKILLPIGMAELHQKDDDVILPNVTADHLSVLPVYDKNNITPDVERKICTTLGRKTETNSLLEGEEMHPEFYRHEYYNDDNLYKHRLQEVNPANDQKKKDSFRLIELMKEWSGFEPKMWGPTIIGFGAYHYKYASGHEGDMPLMGFSPRKAQFSLYVTDPSHNNKKLLEKLGKYSMGKACIYFKKLEDLNLDVLEKLSKETMQFIKKHY
ncbi:MAG: hypothetical protein EOO10_00875 [Chitinophagaceae bacterium]|nr:MAG: hypothetical protein EOO10_00875 [Chitinophagaceae bacterium]